MFFQEKAYEFILYDEWIYLLKLQYVKNGRAYAYAYSRGSKKQLMVYPAWRA